MQSENGRPAVPRPEPEAAVSTAHAAAAPPGAGLGMYLATLRRQWLLAALVVLTATVVGFVVASAKTPSYEATAQILLDRQDPVDALLGTSAPSPDPERDLNTSVQLVGLQPIASRVGRIIGSAESPEALLRRVHVAADGNSDIVSITARDGDPRRAALIANAFASEYSRFRTVSSRAGIEAALEEARQRLRDLPPSDQNSGFARRLTDEVRRLQILAAFQTGGVQVVRHAAAPLAPSGMTPRKAAMVAAVLGVLLACGLVVVITRTDDRLHDENDVERAVGLPVLASIPRPGSARLGTTRNDRGRTDDETDAAYLTLAARLGYGKAGAAPRVVLLTSPDDTASASSVGLELAAALRAISRSAIAIEADLREPCWAAELDLDPSVGLARVLLGEGTFESARLPVPEGLIGSAPSPDDGAAWVVPAGPPVARPETLLAGNAMAALVEEAWGCHDFVLIAAPPMTQEGATLAIAALCDGALLVLRPGWTTDESARRAERSLGDVGVALLGAVFTAVPPRPGRVGSPLHRVWADIPVEPRLRRISTAPERHAASEAAPR